LTGTKSFVLDGSLADLVLVVGRTANGVSVFAVETPNANGLTTVPLQIVDLTRKQSKLNFEGTRARLVGADGRGWDAVSTMLDQAALARAGQIGGAQSVLDMAVDYGKVGYAFGRAIGSFQAMKHKCDDILMRLECARSGVYYAGRAADQGDDELPILASVVKASCSDAFVYAATENIQLHGGIGFTWEFPAHLYYR
jgi:alkylation response protein AidB-like acyl-CoA dehydrogenase